MEHGGDAVQRTVAPAGFFRLAGTGDVEEVDRRDQLEDPLLRRLSLLAEKDLREDGLAWFASTGRSGTTAG